MGAWFEKALAASTITGWTLCALALLGLFGIWRIYALQRTKMRELDIGEDATIRSEYISEMAALRQEIKGLRDENKSLRDEVRELHAMLDGLRREQLTNALATQSAVARAVVDDLPPSTKAALDRLDMLPKKGGGE